MESRKSQDGGLVGIMCDIPYFLEPKKNFSLCLENHVFFGLENPSLLKFSEYKCCFKITKP